MNRRQEAEKELREMGMDPEGFGPILRMISEVDEDRPAVVCGTVGPRGALIPDAEHQPIELDPATIGELSPGVRDLVVWMNAEGFETIDSGDGSNFEAGMDCAAPMPMVVADVEPAELVSEAARLLSLLKLCGVDCTTPEYDHDTDPEMITDPRIHASYDPGDGAAFIVLTHVTSEMLGQKVY